LHALFRPVVIEVRGVTGPNHVAGGVVQPKIDGSAAYGRAEAKAHKDLKEQESAEVELQALGSKKHEPLRPDEWEW
jgi:hypothetical protein